MFKETLELILKRIPLISSVFKYTKTRKSLGGRSLKNLEKIVNSDVSALEYKIQESLVAAIPAAVLSLITALSTTDFFAIESSTPWAKQSIALSSWLFALALPLSSALLANRMGRSLQNAHHYLKTEENVVARKYLFVDGTYGLFSHMFLSFSISLFSYILLIEKVGFSTGFSRYLTNEGISATIGLLLISLIFVFIYRNWIVTNKFLKSQSLPKSNPAKIHFLTIKYFFTSFFWRVIYVFIVLSLLSGLNLIAGRILWLLVSR